MDPAEAKEDVARSRCGQPPQRQTGELRQLPFDQLPDELIADVDLVVMHRHAGNDITAPSASNSTARSIGTPSPSRMSAAHAEPYDAVMVSPDMWPTLDIWAQADLLIHGARIAVDRPAGSSHPKIARYVYPLDYGHLTGTSGGDGEGIDIWIGDAVDETTTAIACTIDLHQRDAELKLLWRCRPDQIALIEAFYAPQPQAVLMLRRPADEATSRAADEHKGEVSDADR